MAEGEGELVAGDTTLTLRAFRRRLEGIVTNVAKEGKCNTIQLDALIFIGLLSSVISVLLSCVSVSNCRGAPVVLLCCTSHATCVLNNSDGLTEET